MKILYNTLILLLISNFLVAQQTDLASPLNIPIVLNGNFGEIRGNHFHAGIDIKTKGETGLPVFSIDYGFISRISVSPSGYGNALYIDHPSGYTSVYGHLESFSPELDKWVESQQYRKKSFVVNLIPEKNQFIFKKGEEIAKSGNSGSSAGPHLHFEIRRTSNQHPINPLFNNFKIKDKTKPSVENLMVYPLSKDSHVLNKTEKQQYKLVYYGGTYHLKGIQSLNIFGKIGFGVDAVDYLDNNWSKCGIYQLEYWVDNKLINSFEMDELDYAKMRYINSHIDYEAYQQDRIEIHKTFIEPGNKLDIYHQTFNAGLFNFNDGKRHKIQLLLYDVNMNFSKIEFYVLSTSPVEHIIPETAAKFDFFTDNSFKTDEIEVSVPVEALYTDVNFEYKKGHSPNGAFSSLHRVHNKFTPLQKSIELKIKTENLPVKLQEKSLIAIFDIKTGKYSSIGGHYEKGWVIASSRNFGDVCVVVDTIAPAIRSLSIKDKKLVEKDRIRFKIEDDLSGINKYTGTIDGKWMLFSYDAKRDLLVYNFDDRMKKSKKHKVQLTVEDQKGNVNVFTSSFYY